MILRLENLTEMSKPILQNLPAISQLQKLNPAILPIYKSALQMVLHSDDLMISQNLSHNSPAAPYQSESPSEAPEAPNCAVRLKNWFINSLLMFINVVTYLLVDHFLTVMFMIYLLMISPIVY